MKYADALIHLENGEAVYREGWVDKEWVKLDPGSADANMGIQPRYYYYFDETHTKQVYEATLADQGADDWFVFGEPKPEPKKAEPKSEVKKAPVRPNRVNKDGFSS